MAALATYKSILLANRQTGLPLETFVSVPLSTWPKEKMNGAMVSLFTKAKEDAVEPRSVRGLFFFQAKNYKITFLDVCNFSHVSDVM